MLRFFLICWISLGAVALMAQPSLRDRPWPQAGDTLFYFTDELPQMIDVLHPGPNQFWNFSSLKAPYVEYQWVAEPRYGKNPQKHTDADIVIIYNDGTEKYFRYGTTTFDCVGGTNYTLGNEQLKGIWSYDQGLPGDGVPLAYDQEVNVQATQSVTLTYGMLPFNLQKSIATGYDSIRIETFYDRNIAADAWGRIQIPGPGALYDVLRVTVTDHMEHRLVGLRGTKWTDLTSSMDEHILGPHKQTHYHFISPEHAQPIATVHTFNDGKPAVVHYMADAFQARYYDRPVDGQWLYAFPNPAFSTVRFKLFDLDAGQYQIRFYNILGKRLFERTYDLAGTETIELNIGHLEKGTYLYSLLDKNGNKLTTKRLIVLKP